MNYKPALSRRKRGYLAADQGFCRLRMAENHPTDVRPYVRYCLKKCLIPLFQQEIHQLLMGVPFKARHGRRDMHV